MDYFARCEVCGDNRFCALIHSDTMWAKLPPEMLVSTFGLRACGGVVLQ